MGSERIHIDPELESLLPGYLENRDRDLLALRSALAAGNRHEIETIGHRMKGSGGAYGLASISELGAQLESVGRQGELGGLESVISALESEIAEIRSELGLF